MAITRAQQLKELIPGLNKIFGDTYKTYDNQYKDIFVTEKSDRSFEEDQKISLFGEARTKNEGGTVFYDTAQEAFTARYNHEIIALGFALTEEAMEDNLYAKLGARYVKALARSMAYTKEVKAANVLNNGFDSNFTGGDGVQLFSTAHPLISGGTNSNTLATAADLNETSLEAAINQIADWTDERGLLIMAKSRKLIIPVELQFVAERLMSSALRTSLSAVTTYAPNDVNAIKKMGMFPEGYTVNNYLTDPDAWFIKTDVPDGLKHFERVKLSTATDGDFDSGNMRYKARERYSFGWSDPLGMFASEGA